MKKKFCSCFLGCVLAGLLLTSPVAAFSFLSTGNLKNPDNDARIAWQEDISEANVTLQYGGAGCDHNGKNWINRNNWVNGNRWRHRHRPRHGSQAPIPSAILLLGSGILGFVGIRLIRKRVTTLPAL